VAVWSKDVVLRISGALATQRAKGGIVSTVTDQLRFMSALVGGEVFSDPSTWNRMTARFHRVFFPVDYGLGVMRYAPPRWMSPGFRLPAVVGHTGSTATWLFHCPDLAVVIAGTFDVAQPALPFRFVPRILRERSPRSGDGQTFQVLRSGSSTSPYPRARTSDTSSSYRT